MALNPNSLVTLDDAKKWLDIPLLNTDLDERAELFINSASEMIENYLDRKLARETYTERYDGLRANKVFLKNYPADKPTVVSFDSDWSFTEPLDTDDYFIQEESLLVFKNAITPRGNQNIQVIYVAGYVTPLSTVQTGIALPSDLKMGCLMLISWLWQVDRDRRLGVTNKSKQNESVSFEDGLPKIIADILRQHKRLEFSNVHATTDTY
jgi:hypothetical protein